MCYMSSTVAGYFINRSNREDKSFSLFQAIKFTYIAHGWHLALSDEPLIADRIEAWQHGPVITPLYTFLQGYNLCINDNIPQSIKIEEVDCIKEEHKKLLNKVYAYHISKTNTELEDLLHEENTPWFSVWNEGKGDKEKIMDDQTREYYLTQITKDVFDTLSEYSPISNKEEALAYLKKTGILLENGSLNPIYNSK